VVQAGRKAGIIRTGPKKGGIAMTSQVRRPESTPRRRASRRAGLFSLGLLALAGAVAFAQGSDDEQAATKAARGRITYRIYCANCHGDGAKGDGRLAALLTVPPTDLTRLTAEDGSFPEDQVRQAVDGRQDVAAHGMRDMPVWGDVFQEPADTPEGAAAARAKIDDLVEYLRSIQPKSE
jgi:mono/diheme cytochrome c family protein